MSKVLVMGQGYVGLPLAMLAVQSGYEVVGVEVDSFRLESLKNGHSYIEDVTSLDIASSIASGRYLPTSDLVQAAGFATAVISVPTPLDDGEPNLSYIQEAATQLAPLVEKGSCVILESTTYPGTTEELLVPLLEQGSGLKAGEDFLVGYSPERIDPGNKRWTLMNTPKLVSGINRKSLEAVDRFFCDLGISTVRVAGTKEAELAKLIENTFRHVNIALINELSQFSSSLGVDIWESIDAASTKPFGFMKFLPGAGVGGHCLPVDPSFLSWAVKKSSGHNFEFVALANRINQSMPAYVANRAVELLVENQVEVETATVAILGMAYKADSSDVRESPSVRLAELLSQKGLRPVGFDPLVPQEKWPAPIPNGQNSSELFDLAIMVTPHSSVDWDSILDRSALILDTTNSVKRPGISQL